MQGWEKRESPEKTRQPAARFPHAKIWERPRRESNPVRLGGRRVVSDHYTTAPLQNNDLRFNRLIRAPSVCELERRNEERGKRQAKRIRVCHIHAVHVVYDCPLYVYQHLWILTNFELISVLHALKYAGATVGERLACRPRRSGFNPRPGHSGFSHLGIVPGRCRWSTSFLGDLPFLPPFHSGAATFSPQVPSSALKFLRVRAVQISSLLSTLTKVVAILAARCLAMTLLLALEKIRFRSHPVSSLTCGNSRRLHSGSSYPSSSRLVVLPKVRVCSGNYPRDIIINTRRIKTLSFPECLSKNVSIGQLLWTPLGTSAVARPPGTTAENCTNPSSVDRETVISLQTERALWSAGTLLYSVRRSGERSAPWAWLRPSWNLSCGRSHDVAVSSYHYSCLALPVVIHFSKFKPCVPQCIKVKPAQILRKFTFMSCYHIVLRLGAARVVAIRTGRGRGGSCLVLQFPARRPGLETRPRHARCFRLWGTRHLTSVATHYLTSYTLMRVFDAIMTVLGVLRARVAILRLPVLFAATNGSTTILKYTVEDLQQLVASVGHPPVRHTFVRLLDERFTTKLRTSVNMIEVQRRRRTECDIEPPSRATMIRLRDKSVRNEELSTATIHYNVMKTSNKTSPLISSHLLLTYSARLNTCIFNQTLHFIILYFAVRLVRGHGVPWLHCSPPTKANRVQSPGGSHSDFRKSESYRTMPLVGGFSRISRFHRPYIPALLHSHLISPSSALKTSPFHDELQMCKHELTVLRNVCLACLKPTLAHCLFAASPLRAQRSTCVQPFRQRLA
ncbi:hypothetical protein PR048_013499 [Dryococelus australis]|uniref:Uncharacterized protein n=1 Tax=Dryococelus australis TaxID=614101 RepID=A0ABQ9HSC4_9NEOP|nr:hypothetical protein PR048_013499 [Dryococelus australis]